MAKEIEVGEIFNKLTVIDVAISYKNRSRLGKQNSRARWICKCDCGDINTYIGSLLRRGKSTQCRNCSYRGRPQSKLKKNFTQRLYDLTVGTSKKDKSLTEDEFRYLIKQNCFYCKTEPKESRYIKGTKYSPIETFPVNGIDRIDNSSGYTINNSVPCCYHCNTLKGAITLEMIKKIYEFSFKK